ncbi:MAG: c-type cytochrome [Steroidobacteraceae bacterium]
MTMFWSLWVMFLVVLNAGITLFLFMWAQKVEIPVLQDGTTGHVWAHGVLREGVRRLPRWWVAASASFFIWGVGYLLLFPGFGAFKGMLGWTSHQEHAVAVAVNDANVADLYSQFASLTPAALAANEEALHMGERLFIDNCAACHQRDARGNPRLGAPNLVDADWIWGGDDASITASILEGRQGLMPPLGSLGADKVTAVANYVLSLSGAAHDQAMAASGAQEFVVCAACHGASGEGNPLLGAPRLSDSTWSWGKGDLAMIESTVTNGAQGVMPAWKSRLTQDDARVIIAWLRSQSRDRLARL